VLWSKVSEGQRENKIELIYPSQRTIMIYKLWTQKRTCNLPTN